ncbi:EscU/YscU/HrcU family type III secretion system export apparatus switch protein [Halomonas sp. WWR20]
MNNAPPRPDKRRQAVALAYRDSTESPSVVAKGYGELAERIIAAAKDQGVFVHDAPELVGLLMGVDLDARIPPALYQVIAELLVWVHDVQQSASTDMAKPR